MEIYNTTTKTTVEIIALDANTGIEWTQDLLGNHDATQYNDDLDRHEMDQDNVDWWSEYTNGITLADDRKKELKNNHYDERPELFEKLETEWVSGNWNDMEFEPGYKENLLNELEEELN